MAPASGDLSATISTSDIIINVVSLPPLSISNAVTVVATVSGADRITGASIDAPGIGAIVDSSVTVGPARARAYIRVVGLPNMPYTYGPTVLHVTSGSASADVPLTIHAGDDVRALNQLQYPQGAQLVQGREVLAFTSPTRVRIADAPAGLSLREAVAGSAVQTFATASIAPNVAHRVLVHRVDEHGWAYGTDPLVVVVRSATPNPAVRVRARGIAGGLHYASPQLTILTAVAQSGALVTVSAPGGHTEPQLTGLRSIVTDLWQRPYLLYRDGRLGRTLNGAQREVEFLGNLDPADVAADGSLLMRDGAVWFTSQGFGFQALDAATGVSYLPALPATAATGFVAITSDGTFPPPFRGMMLAAASDGRLWAASASQAFAPTAQRLPSAPLEMVAPGAFLRDGAVYGTITYGARLADGSVWTWRAATPGNPASLTAPTQIPGLVAAHLFANENGLVAVRADGSVAMWGQSPGAGAPGDACTPYTLCEHPEVAGLREATFIGFVRADGLAINTSSAGVAFGSGQPPLVVPE